MVIMATRRCEGSAVWLAAAWRFLWLSRVRGKRRRMERADRWCGGGSRGPHTHCRDFGVRAPGCLYELAPDVALVERRDEHKSTSDSNAHLLQLD